MTEYVARIGGNTCTAPYHGRGKGEEEVRRGPGRRDHHHSLSCLRRVGQNERFRRGPGMNSFPEDSHWVSTEIMIRSFGIQTHDEDHVVSAVVL